MVLYAWSLVVADERRENMIIEELALAAENIGMVRLEAQRLRDLARDRLVAQASAFERLRRAQWAMMLFQAWSAAASASSSRIAAGRCSDEDQTRSISMVESDV